MFNLPAPPDGLRYFTCDLHIHIGRACDRPIKLTAARDLTFANIAREASERKGVEVVGIIDCASPAVLTEIRNCLDDGTMAEQPGGGLVYAPQRDRARPTTVILAAEIETVEREGVGRLSHHVGFFRTLDAITAFSDTLSQFVKNMNLSSQNCHSSAVELLRLVCELGGFLVPAHAFTPHKSLYGSSARRLTQLFDPHGDAVFCVELGLSADSSLADRIDELHTRTFITNSDAHSLPKIAREYNVIALGAPTFDELRLALRHEQGRFIAANYGLDPKLGKYHRTFCEACQQVQVAEPPVQACALCGSTNVTRGVLDRIVEIQDRPAPNSPPHRPPYRYQVPLQFLPKLGPTTLNKLLNRFGTEMFVLHQATAEELTQVVAPAIAETILSARDGTLQLLPGGGGRYGRAVGSAAETQLRLL